MLLRSSYYLRHAKFLPKNPNLFVFISQCEFLDCGFLNTFHRVIIKYLFIVIVIRFSFFFIVVDFIIKH